MSGGAEQGTEAQPAAGPAGIAESKVFISYASQDAAVANGVVETLERSGIKCWIAPRDVVAGEFYADAIVRAIDAAPALVLILSQDAAASHHILREVERASSKRHPVISLRIDKAPIPPALEYFLNTSQWLDVADGDPSRAFPKLVEAVRRALTDAPVSAASDTYIKHALGEPAPRFNRHTIALVAGLIILALAALVIDRVWLLRHAESADHTTANSAPTQTPTPSAAEAISFTPPAHSIAVLPFVNMSGDPQQEYFSDGVTEELLNSLSRLNQLQVVARTSSFSFKGQNVDVTTIAHKLNVQSILEGSVRRAGNTVRITVQLINAVTGFHEWSQTYDRKLSDILQVQTDIATSIAKQLEIKLGADPGRFELGGTKNSDAYDAYLSGTQAAVIGDTHQSEGELRAALAAFDRAIAIDPRFAFAFAKRALCLINITYYESDVASRVTLRQEARSAAEQAVELAPNLGEAHLALAKVLFAGFFDFAAAEPEFDRALALAPGSATVQRDFARFASQMTRSSAALKAARQAVLLDPQNPRSYANLADVLDESRDYPDALSVLTHARLLFPSSPIIEGFLVGALLASNQVQLALQNCESPSNPISEWGRHSCLARAYYAVGRPAEAERHLERLMALGGDSDAMNYASIYAQWGNSTAALRWLKKAEAFRDPGLTGIKVNHELDPIRNEPEFKAILARMNFPP